MTTRQTPDAVREASWTGDPNKLANELRRVANSWGPGFQFPQLLRDAADEIDCLSALDSRAGKWRERWHGSAPEKGSAIVDDCGNLIAYVGGDTATHAAVTRIVAAHNATPAPAVDAVPAGEVEPETVAGLVTQHCSEEGSGPDVGLSLGLGNGRCLYFGELLNRDGGDLGIVFHGPAGYRHAAPYSDWREIADLIECRVGPAVELLADDARTKREALEAVAAAMLNGGDGAVGDFGWNITKLNRARPLIRAALSHGEGR